MVLLSDNRIHNVGMDKVTFRLPKEELARLDSLVQNSNEFDQRSPAIRYAVREMLQKANGDAHE